MPLHKSENDLTDDQFIDPSNEVEIEYVARLCGITPSALLELIKSEGTKDRRLLMEAAEQLKAGNGESHN